MHFPHAFFIRYQPPNIRLDEEVFRLRLQKTSSRRLQDILIKTNIFALVIHLQKTIEDVFKTFYSSPIYSYWPYVFNTSCQYVFKMFSRRFQDVFKTFSSRRFLQDVFKASRRLNKTSSRRLQSVKKSCKNVFKTSSRPFQDLQVLQEFFKAYHQVKLFLLASLREVLQKRFSTDGFA